MEAISLRHKEEFILFCLMMELSGKVFFFTQRRTSGTSGIETRVLSRFRLILKVKFWNNVRLFGLLGGRKT